MSVDINLIKELRDLTKAPLKDVKEALIEVDGDMDKAKEYLREKGAAKAAKKSDRETSEWIVKIKSQDGKVCGVKIACETDFVAKNDTFRSLVDEILEKVIENGELVDSKEDLDSSFVEEIDQLLKDNFVKIGENMQFVDCFFQEVPNDVYIYTHPGSRIVTAVFYKGDEGIAKELALQISAMSPDYISRDDVPADKIEKMKDKFAQEFKEQGKPENVIEQIVDGKIDKELSQDVLLEQVYIRDDSQKIKDICDDEFEINNYIRYSI